jgi:hypothetical protein
MNSQTVKLTVISDAGGNVVATMFAQKPAGDGPSLRIVPALPEHRMCDIEVPADFQQLSAADLHDKVKQCL